MLLEMPASYIAVLIEVPATLFPIQLSANVSWEVADDGPGTWVPATHVEDLNGSWLQSGLALASVTVSGVNLR